MTGEAKHTPGPWQCYADLPSTDPNWHIVTDPSRMRVLANIHIEPGNPTDEANARLIVAAPEILIALIAAESFISGFEGDELQEDIDALLASIRASISKAGGHPCPGAWQPIETAPKDGTPILARYMWLGEHRYLVIRRSQNGPWWLADHDGLIKHDDDKAKPSNYEFTHWRPITPPALDGSATASSGVSQND